MTHPNADTLLEFVLQTLEESDNSIVREHLSTCEQCRELQQMLEGEVKRLESIDMHFDVPSPPRLPRRSRLLMTVSRLAAVLAVGFLLGYVTAQLFDPVRPIPVQQRLIPTQVEVSSSGYIPCQAVDLKTIRAR
jgi:predicted anti-sigma-YlaC factor YlaD